MSEPGAEDPVPDADAVTEIEEPQQEEEEAPQEQEQEAAVVVLDEPTEAEPTPASPGPRSSSNKVAPMSPGGAADKPDVSERSVARNSSARTLSACRGALAGIVGPETHSNRSLMI